MYASEVITYQELEEAIDNRIKHAKEICAENAIFTKSEADKLFALELFLIHLPVDWEFQKKLENKLIEAQKEIKKKSADKFSA